MKEEEEEEEVKEEQRERICQRGHMACEPKAKNIVFPFLFIELKLSAIILLHSLTLCATVERETEGEREREFRLL